jgi:RNA polymerase sigma factor (TIGR02999 family)
MNIERKTYAATLKLIERARASGCGRFATVYPSIMSDVTQILQSIEQGDPQAADRLLPLVYDELRRLAAQKLANEKPGQTLQPTALVHEAYLRLVASGDDESQQEPSWKCRGHFFAAAAEAMRRILVDSARRKKRVKHGGERHRMELNEPSIPVDSSADDILALDEALNRLTLEDPAAAHVVHLHFFAGLPIEQVAETLGVARATAYRQWAYARVWLRSAMDADETLA